MTASGHARLFVALDLPLDVREALGWWGRAARHEVGPMRLLGIESLHVTLAFLGSRSVNEIDVIAGAMGEGTLGATVGTLELGAPLWLPRRNPRLLAAELHDDGGGLGALQARLVSALCGAIEWEPDRRAFRPHVTVARMRAGGGPPRRALPATPGVRFGVETVTLYRSWLAPSGATYEGLASAGV